MLLQNKQTLKNYEVKKVDFDKMGKGTQNLFTILNSIDADEIKDQVIENNIKPDTGKNKTITLNKNK